MNFHWPYYQPFADARYPRSPYVFLSNGLEQVVGLRGKFPTSKTTGYTVVTFRTRHYIPYTAGAIRLRYCNGYATSGEQLPANAIGLRVGYELTVGSAPIKTTWDGMESVTLQPGQTRDTDFLCSSIVGGSYLWVRTEVTVTAGQDVPLGYITTAANNEGLSVGNARAFSSTIPDVTGNAFAPVAILGRLATPMPSVALIGDSIMDGVNDGTGNSGFMVPALNNQYPFVNLACSGEYSSHWGTVSPRRVAQALRCPIAVIEYGNNDLYNSVSAATLLANNQSIATFLKRGGVQKVFVTTITPRVSKVNAGLAENWTLANQQYNAAMNTQRTTYNTSIRAVPAPFDGCFDIAALVEEPTDHGKIIPAYMNDAGQGVHPNATGYAAMVPAIDLSRFAL